MYGEVRRLSAYSGALINRQMSALHADYFMCIRCKSSLQNWKAMGSKNRVTGLHTSTAT